MKFSHVSIIAIFFVLLAVSIAGCTSSGPATPAASATGGELNGEAASGSMSGSDLFGGLEYNWVEYKTSSDIGGQQMTIYMKWTKEGKCSMRFEGAGSELMAGMPTEMDCSTTGSAEAQSNPTDFSSDINMVKVRTETITVPAGTFVADKYTTTVEGTTSTFWIVAGKPLIKMEGGGAEGTIVTELNDWG